MQERRRSARWPVNQHAALKLKDAAEGLFCQIKDISSKGVKVSLYTKLPQDRLFKMSLQLSENNTVDVEAWIAWCKVIDGVNHCGIYFSRIKDADKDKIYKFIDKHRFSGSEQQVCLGTARVEKERGGEGMQDHRIFERFRKEFSARFIGLGGKEEQAKTFDVSAKGLGVSTVNELEFNTSLEIWLDVPGSTDPLYTRGQVVWTKLAGAAGYRSGISLERADLMGVSRLLRAK